MTTSNLRKNTIKATIKDFFGIFTLPNANNGYDGFIMNNSFSQEFDEFVKELLVNHTPKYLDRYSFQLGELVLWGENYPYSFGTIDNCLENTDEIKKKFRRKRPSRQTIGIMYSMLNNK